MIAVRVYKGINLLLDSFIQLWKSRLTNNHVAWNDHHTHDIAMYYFIAIGSNFHTCSSSLLYCWIYKIQDFFLFPVFISWILLLRFKFLGTLLYISIRIHTYDSSNSAELNKFRRRQNYYMHCPSQGASTRHTGEMYEYPIDIFSAAVLVHVKNVHAFWGRKVGNMSLSVLKESAHILWSYF